VWSERGFIHVTLPCCPQMLFWNILTWHSVYRSEVSLEVLLVIVGNELSVFVLHTIINHLKWMHITRLLLSYNNYYKKWLIDSFIDGNLLKYWRSNFHMKLRTVYSTLLLLYFEIPSKADAFRTSMVVL
jgi:hypothetical protein